MNTVPDVWRQPFPDDEIPFILAGILRCMATVKKQSPNEHENLLTTRLWKQLRRDAELNVRPTHLDTEVWEINEENADGKIGRLDLRFIYSTGTIKPWPCFAIEAKRLHVTFPNAGWQSLISEYVTSDTSRPVEDEQGMMCFVSGRYSRGLRAGAMLGYVFDGNVEAARVSIAAAIQRHEKKLKLASARWAPDASVIPGISGISESQHDFGKGALIENQFRNIFTIFHLLVPV